MSLMGESKPLVYISLEAKHILYIKHIHYLVSTRGGKHILYI